jgi:hypothetical protein
MTWRRQFDWPAWTQGQGKRGGGDGLLKHALTREDEKGKEKGHGGDGAPFIGNAAGVGDRLRAAPRGSEAWRGGVEPAQRSGDAAWPAAA